LYQYVIWYMSLCVGDCLVCRLQLPTQSDIYQMTYWYNWFSWWWALGCSKLFSWKLLFENFSKFCKENSSFITIWQE